MFRVAGSITSFCSQTWLFTCRSQLGGKDVGMDSSGWYSTPHQTNGYGRDAYLSPDPTNSRTNGMAVDSVEDSQELLSAYPLASLNPTGHGQNPCIDAIRSSKTDAYILIFSSLAPVGHPLALRPAAVIRPTTILRAERVHVPIPELDSV